MFLLFIYYLILRALVLVYQVSRSLRIVNVEEGGHLICCHISSYSLLSLIVEQNTFVI
jgi:hypothetical protein